MGRANKLKKERWSLLKKALLNRKFFPEKFKSPEREKSKLFRIVAGTSVSAATIVSASYGLPQGATVVSGNVTINTDPSQLVINQSTDKAILNWISFSIDRGELVRFNQPGINSVILNRVTGQDPSLILGQLTANGKVFLINPNGILFGKSAVVDVAGLVATTLNISDTDFLSGNYRFTQLENKDLAQIVNKGEIKVSDGGFIVLTAPSVKNEGLIYAKVGTVVLSSGTQFKFDFTGNDLITFTVESPVNKTVKDLNGNTVNDGILNKGIIKNDGGTVLLTGDAVSNVFSSIVNNEGIVEANSLSIKGGKIVIEGNSGTVVNTGIIDVSSEVRGKKGSISITGDKIVNNGTIKADGNSGADGGEIYIYSDTLTDLNENSTIQALGKGTDSDGGFIEVSSDKEVRLGGKIYVYSEKGKGGTVLIDPTDLTIDTNYYSAGGDYTFEATNSITVNENIIISTRNTGAPTANGTAPNDQLTSPSIGNSGNLELKAPNITIKSGAKLLTFADSNFTSGTLKLTASGKDTNITIHQNALLKGGDITISATSNDDGSFDSATDTASRVYMDFLSSSNQYFSPGALINVNAVSKIEVQSNVNIEGNSIDIKAHSTGHASGKVTLDRSTVSYVTVTSKSEVIIDGNINATGNVTISSKSDETLISEAKSVNIGQRATGQEMYLTLAYGKGDLTSKVNVGSTSNIQGSSISINSSGTKNVSIIGAAAAYEDGTLSGGIAIGFLNDTIETSVSGQIRSNSGNVSISSNLDVADLTIKSTAASGTGKAGKVLDYQTYFTVKSVNQFIDKHSPQAKSQSGKSKFNFSAVVTYLENKSDVQAFISSGGNIYSNSNIDIKSELTYPASGMEVKASSSVNNNDQYKKDYSFAGTFNIIKSDETVKAYIGSNSSVNLLGDLSVYSNIYIPHSLTPNFKDGYLYNYDMVDFFSDVGSYLDQLKPNSLSLSTSGGQVVGAAGMINLIEISETSQAYIDSNVSINQDQNYVTNPGSISVKADNTFEYYSVSGDIGGEFSGQDKAGVGGSYNGFDLTFDTQAYINENVTLSAENLHVKANADIFLANVSVAGGLADEYGISGVFNYLKLNETTKSFIGQNSNVKIGTTPVDINNNGIIDTNETESLIVEAVSRNRLLNTAGGIVKSHSVGIGASVSINDVNRTTEAYISGVITTDGNIRINSKTEGWVIAASIAGTYTSPNKFKGIEEDDPLDGASLPNLFGESKQDASKPQSGISISGTSSVNLVKSNTKAYINNGTITGNSGSAGNINIESKDTSGIYASGGTVAVAKTSSSGAGLSGAYFGNYITTDIHSYISSSNISSNSAVLNSTDSTVIMAVGGGGSVAINDESKISVSLAGAVTKNTVNKNISSYISSSTVSTSGQLNINVLDEFDIVSAAGDISVSGHAAGAAIAINDVSGEEKSYIENSDISSDSVTVKSENNSNYKDISVSASASLDKLAAAASISINNISVNNRSFISGKINSGVSSVNDITVESISTQDITVISGSTAVNKNLSGLGIGGSASYNSVSNTVDSYVESGSITSSAGNLNVSSKQSINSISVSINTQISKLNIGVNLVVNNFNNFTRSYITDTTADIFGSVAVLSTYEGNNEVYGGTVQGGKGGFGIGGSGAVNMYENTTESYIKSSSITGKGNKGVTHSNADQNKNTETSSGVVVISDSRETEKVGTATATVNVSGVLALDGSVSVDLFKNKTNAYIQDSNINPNNTTSNPAQSVKVKAFSGATIDVGNGGLNFGSNAGVGLSAGIVKIKNETNSFIKGSSVNSRGGSVQVISKTLEDILTVSVAGSISKNISFAGSGNGIYLEGVNTAYIESSTVRSEGNIDVKAEDTVKVGDKDQNGKYTAGAISGSVSVGGTSVGIGGAVNVVRVNNTTHSYIISSTTDSLYNTNVSSLSDKLFSMYAANVAASATAGIGGSVNVLIVSTDTKAYIGSDSNGNGSTVNNSISGTTQSVNISSTDKTDYKGGVGSGEVSKTIAAGGAVDVAIINVKNRAYIGNNTNIKSGYSLGITSYTETNTNSTVIAFGGGLGGVSGSVSLANIGKAFDADQDEASGDIGGNIDGSLNVYSDIDTGNDNFNNDLTDAKTGLSISNTVDPGANFESITASFIGENSNVTSGSGGIRINATEMTNMSSVVGAISGGAVGVSGSVSVQKNYSNLFSYINSGSTVLSSGNISLNSVRTVNAGLNTYAGEGGGVTLGAAVSYLYLGGDIYSYLGDNTNILETSKLSLSSKETNTAEVKAYGTHVGVAVAGGAGAKVVLESNVHSYTGNNTKIGDQTDKNKVKNVSLTAETDTTVRASAVPVNVGAVSAQAAVVDIFYQTNVRSYTGLNNHIFTSGTLEIGSKGIYEIYGSTTGVNLGGAAVGASITKIKISPDIKSYVSDGNKIEGKDINIYSKIEDPNNSNTDKSAYAEAKSSASSGGSLLGSNASVSEITNTTNIETFIGSGSEIAYENNLTLESYLKSRSYSYATGLGVGFIGIGASVTKNTSEINVTSGLRSNTYIHSNSGSFNINSYANYGSKAESVAGSGGVVAGNAAVAENEIKGTNRIYLDPNSKIKGKYGNIKSVRDIQFNSFADSVNASAVGKSGAYSNDYVYDSNSKIDIGFGSSIEGYSLSIYSENKHTKNTSGWFGGSDNTKAGSGGILSGAASLSKTTLKNSTSSVNISDGATINLLGNPTTFDNLERLLIEAYGIINLETKAKLTAGGTIVGAKSEARIYAKENIGSSVNIGKNVKINVKGNLTIAASTSGEGKVQAKTNTYGFASAGQGKSSVDLYVEDYVNIGSGTDIKVFGNADILAGINSKGSGSLKTEALTDVYNKTAIAYSGTPDADAVSSKNTLINIDSSSIKTGKDINLTSKKGDISAYGYGKATDASREAVEKITSTISQTFGGDEVSLDTIAGSNKVLGTGSILLNGNIETGLYRHVYVIFGNNMNPGFYVSEGVDKNNNVASNLVPNTVRHENGQWNVYDQNGNYIKTLTPDSVSEVGIDWEILEDIRIATSLDKQIEELKKIKATYPELAQDIDATITTLEGQKTDPATNQTTHIIKLKDVVASSGDINLRADNVYGSGSMKAPGDVKIEIINKSPLPIQVGRVEIPKEYGGNIRYNGKKISRVEDILTNNKNKFLPVNLSVEDASSSSPPSILIKSEFNKQYVGSDSRGNNFYIHPPPILIGPINAISANDDSVSVSGSSPTGTQAIFNFNGSVTIDNLYGSVFVTQDIYANTISISAGGNFVFNNPDLVYNVGYDPASYFSDLETYAKTKLIFSSNGSYSTDTPSTIGSPNPLQDYYDSKIAGTKDHSDKHLLAGNNIFINAEVININGLIQSGIPYKDVVITDDMINNAISSGNYTIFNGEKQYDPSRDMFVGGYRVTINPDEKRVYVSGLNVSGGTVFLSGKIANTGGGKINVIDGFGRINITNQSSYQLVVDSIDTGNVEGKVTIVDKMKDNGTGKYLVTEIKRVGNEVRVYTNQGVDTTQAVVLSSQTTGRSAVYNPEEGLRYYWMNGYTTSSVSYTKYRKEYNKFLGFIPISEREFTSSDIISQTTQTLNNSDIDKGYVQGFMRDNNNNIITNPPDYNLDKVTSTNYSYKFTIDSSGSYWSGLSRKTWIERLEIQYSGKTTKFYNSVKADYPIDISFIGEDVGQVNINSSTDVVLKGGITNYNGTVNINAGNSIYNESLAPIKSSVINLNSPNLVGTSENPIRVSGDPAVSVSTNVGGVYIDSVSSNITVTSGINTAGDLRLRSDKGITVLGTLKGKNIHLEAFDGQITSGNPADPYINIDTDINNNGKLYMSATHGDIFVRELTGDLSVDTVKTFGNVFIQVVDGSLVDGNPNENVDKRTALELELLYNDLGLKGTSAQQLRDQQINAFKQNMELEYDRYWREYRDLKLNPDGTYSYTPYEYVEFKLTPEEVDAFKAQGWTDKMISDYENDLTQKYNTWGQSDYNPNFTYTLTQSELDELSGNGWTDDQINNTLPASLFTKNVTDTEYKIEDPNIIGNNITLIAKGTIGKDKKDNIVFYYNDTGRYTQTELNEIKRALVAAERQDIEIDPNREVIIIKQRDDIDVEALGTIQAIAGGSVYIGSESNINVTNIYSKNNWVRIKTGQGIYSSSGGLNVDAPEGLILEASNGSIGTDTNPLSVSTGPNGTVTARASGDINILVPYGNLNLDYIYSKSHVNLMTPNGSIVDFYNDTVDDITARSLTLTAGLYGGMTGSYNEALDINITNEEGKINLYGYGSFNIYQQNSILFGDINIGGNLTPRTHGDITFTGKVAANSIEIDIPGNINVNENSGIATVTGLIFKSNSGNINIRSSISSNGYISLLSSGSIYSSERIYSSGVSLIKAPGDITFEYNGAVGSATSLTINAGGNLTVKSVGGLFAPELNITSSKSIYLNSSVSGNTVDIVSTNDFTADTKGYIRGYTYLNINSGGSFTAKNGLSAKGNITLRSANDMTLTGFVIGNNIDINSGGNFTADSDLYISSINSVKISSTGDLFLGIKTTSRGEINLSGKNITITKTVESVEDIDFKEPEFHLELDLNEIVDFINTNRTSIAQYLEGGINLIQLGQKSQSIYNQHLTFLSTLDLNTGIYARVSDFIFLNQTPTTTLTNTPQTGETGSQLVVRNPIQRVSYTPPTVTITPSNNDSIIINTPGDVNINTAVLTTGQLDISGKNIYIKGLAGGKYLNINAGADITLGEHTLLHGIFSANITSPTKIQGSKIAIATNGEMNISAPTIEAEGFIYAFNNVNPTIKQITDYLDPVLNLNYILDTLDLNPSVDASINIAGGEKIDFKGAVLSTGGIDISSKDISMTSVIAGNYVSITSPSSVTIGNDSVVYGVTTIDIDAGGDLSIDGFLGNNGIVNLNSGGDVLIKGSAVSIADLPLDLDTIIDSAGKISAGDVYSAIVDFAGTYNPSDTNGVFLNAVNGDITISGNFVSTATAKFTTNNVYISGTAGAKNFIAEVPGDFITEEKSIVYNLGKQIIDVEGYVKIGGYLSGTGEVRISSDKDVTVSGYILSVGNVPFTIDDLVRVVGSGNVDLPYEKVKNFDGEFNALNNNIIDIYAKGKVDVTGYILTMADVTLKADETLNIDHVVLGNSVTLESPNDIPIKDNTIIASYDFVTINTPFNVQVGGTVATNGSATINGNNIYISGRVLSNDKLPINLSDYIKKALDMTPDSLFTELKDDAYNLTGNDINTVNVNGKGYVDITGGIVSNARVNIDAGSYLNIGGIGVVTVNGANLNAKDNINITSVVKATEKDVLIKTESDISLDGSVFGFTDVNLEAGGNIDTKDKSSIYGNNSVKVTSGSNTVFRGFVGSKEKLEIKSKNNLSLKGYFGVHPDFNFSHTEFTENSESSEFLNKIKETKNSYTFKNSGTATVISETGDLIISGSVLSSNKLDISGKRIFITGVTGAESIEFNTPDLFVAGQKSVIYENSDQNLSSHGDLIIDGYIGSGGDITVSSGGNLILGGYAVSNSSQPVTLNDLYKATDSDGTNFVNKGNEFIKNYKSNIDFSSKKSVSLTSKGYTEISGGVLSSSSVNITSENSVYIKNLGVISGENLSIKSGKNIELYSGVKALKGLLNITANDRIVKIGGPREIDNLDIEAVNTELYGFNGIGSKDSPITIKTDKLNASTENGGIFIEIYGDSYIETASSEKDINVALKDGDLTFSKIRSNSGKVGLSAENGSITGINDPSIEAGDSIFIEGSPVSFTGTKPIKIKLNKNIFSVDSNNDRWVFQMTEPVPDWIVFNKTLYGGKKIDVVMEALSSVTVPPEEILRIIEQDILESEENNRNEVVNYSHLEQTW